MFKFSFFIYIDRNKSNKPSERNLPKRSIMHTISMMCFRASVMFEVDFCLRTHCTCKANTCNIKVSHQSLLDQNFRMDNTKEFSLRLYLLFILFYPISFQQKICAFCVQVWKLSVWSSGRAELHSFSFTYELKRRAFKNGDARTSPHQQSCFLSDAHPWMNLKVSLRNNEAQREYGNETAEASVHSAPSSRS